jgi:anti-sigma B factor antagonist
MIRDPRSTTPHSDRKDDAMDFRLDVDRRGPFTVVSVFGQVDFATALDLKQLLTDTLLSGQVHLVVDLDGVDFLESTGLGTLIGGRRRALGMSGSFTLVCTKEELLKVLRVTGMTSVFPIRSSVDEAVAELA